MSRTRSSSRRRYSDEEDVPVQQPMLRRSPSQPKKKQIIPLSDTSLIEDVARAKRAYVHREPSDDYEYEDDEEEDEEEEYIQPRRRRDAHVRKRKTSVMHTELEQEEIANSFSQPSSWFSWIPFFGSRKQKVDDEVEGEDKEKKIEKKDKSSKEKVGIWACNLVYTYRIFFG